MYSLDDVLLLASAIRSINNGDKLSLEEEKMFNASYDSFFISRAKRLKGVNIDPNNISDGLRSCGLDKVAEWYDRKDNRTSCEVFSYFINGVIKDNSIDIDIKKDLLLFKALLQKKNKPVTLETLFVLAHEGLYDDATIRSMFNNTVERDKFFEKLNGCIIEESICKMYMDSYNPSDFSSIKIERGTFDNPMIMVTGLNRTMMPKLEGDIYDEVSFIAISDLHLDKDCYRSDGSFDDKRFEENMMAFGAFKNALFGDLKKQGQKLGAIVFTGDVIEGFTKGDKKPVFVPRNKDELLGKYIKFQKRNPDFGISVDEAYGPGFVLYIAGNHDMTVGKEMFDRFMHTLSKDAMFLGAGQARIKVGEEFISFLHHDSLDWGMPGYDLSYQGRNSKNRSVFQFDNFFKICEDYLETVSDKSNYTVFQLFVDVGDRMKKENPELYRFYEPYITSIGNSPAFFHRNMFISGGKLIRQTGDDEYPKSMKFHDYMKENPDLVESIIKNGGIIPEFGRNDRYRPIVTSLSHFHSDIGDKDERLSFSLGEGEEKVAPIAVSEDHRTFSNGANIFSVTLYEAALEKNHVTSVGVIPLLASVKKNVVKGRMSFDVDLDYRIGEEVSVRKR